MSESDELREAIRTAVLSVYNRHDTTAPLNHVNIVEWVDAVLAVVPTVTKPVVPVCMYCDETRALHEHYSGACQARGSGNTRYSERSGWNT